MTQETQAGHDGPATADMQTWVRYVYEIRLLDGDSIWARPSEGAASGSDLETLHRRLGTDPFVQIGDTVVRSENIRSVQLREDDGSGDGSGLIESLKQRLGGGRMTSYDTEEVTQTRGRAGRPAASRDDGPGFADRYVGYGRRPWSETKPFFLTSEFLTLLATIAAVAIGMAASDSFDSPRGFTLIAALAAAYMIARGLAKSGTRDPNPDRDRY
jgi:hypothetical protein